MYVCMYVIMYTYVSMLQASMMQSGDSIPDIVTTVSGYIRLILDPLFAAVLHIKVRRRFWVRCFVLGLPRMYFDWQLNLRPLRITW